jgi:hypothetical protein
MNRYERDALAHARSIWYRVGAAAAIILALFVLFGAGGCSSVPAEPCTSLACLKAEQQHQQFLYCMGSDPDRRRVGRVQTFPGGESWADYCRSITR